MTTHQGRGDHDIPTYVADLTPFFDFSQQEFKAPGGFADVYSITLGRQKYAMKVPRIFSYDGDEVAMKKDFYFELMSWLKVGTHDNILEFGGICYTTILASRPQPCFLSRWQENGQLNDYLKRSPDIDLLEIMQGVFGGLRHMHEMNVAHCDLRGGNILVSPSGAPLLADFGLSKQLGRDSSTSVGSGTYRWMARELLDANFVPSGQEMSSRRSTASDIWSLGMTILELLSGRNPYYNYEADVYVIQVIARGEKPKYPGILHTSWIAYEDMLLEICRRCWVCDPSERPSIQTLDDELRDLHDFGSIQGSEDSNSDDSSLTPRARPQDDTAELLGHISALSLSVRDDATDDDERQPSFGNSLRNSEREEARHSTPPLSTGEDTAASSGSGSSGESDNWTFDACSISHMTAFVNHLVASKKFRKHAIHSEKEGPDHAPTWYVSISIDGIILGKACGPNKTLAQEEAAKQAFAKIENEAIDPEVPYLPIFLNRLNVRGSRCHSQFRWHTEVLKWTGKTCGERMATLYWKGIVVGRGKGVSETKAKGEAARAAATAGILLDR